MDAKVHIFTATGLGRGRVASPTLGSLYPQEKPPRFSFYRRLSGPQDQSGHEVKKNLHPTDIWNRTRAVQPAAKRLAV